MSTDDRGRASRDHLGEQRARLRHAVRNLPVGELVYAVPASVGEPLVGPVVAVDGVSLAIDASDIGVVWVHVADCPDLARSIDRP